MSERVRCPECSFELPANAPQGLCPACLLKQAMESRQSQGSNDTDRTPTPDPHRTTSVDPGQAQPGRPAWTEGTVGAAGGASQRIRIVRLHREGGLGEGFLARDD